MMFNNKIALVGILMACAFQGIHCGEYERCVDKLNRSTYLCSNTESENVQKQMQYIIEKNSRELCKTNTHCKKGFGEDSKHCGLLFLENCTDLCVEDAQKILTEKYPKYFSIINGNGPLRSECLCQAKFGEYCINGQGLESKCYDVINDNNYINEYDVCNQCYLHTYEFSKAIDNSEIFDLFQRDYC